MGKRLSDIDRAIAGYEAKVADLQRLIAALKEVKQAKTPRRPKAKAGPKAAETPAG